jgi:hypothetical protein
MSISPSTRTLLGLSALALLLACGGGATARTEAAAPAPAPKPPTATEPFWTSDSPERPHRARALSFTAATGAPLRLSEAEVARLGESTGETPRVATPEIPAATPLRIVTGLRSFTYHQENATTLQPLDLTAAVIQALVPNAAGGFDTLAGVGHADGTFSIPNVPVGNYWLRFGSTYVWTSVDHVEWVLDAYGRPDVAYPGNPTALAMNAGNLAAWQATDELLYNAPNQGMVLSVPPSTVGVTNAPAPGATALTNYTYDFTTIGLGLLESGKGDQAYLNQLTTRTTAGNTYRALGRAWNLPALTMVDGVNSTANGAFLDLPQTSTLRLNWKRSALAAMTPQVNPAATVTGTEFGLWASPTGLASGIPSSAFQLFTYDSGATTAATDLDLGDLAYGNPYPAAWNLLAETYFIWSVNYLAPGATVPATLQRSSYTATNTLPTGAAPLAPLVGPVQNPKVNGKDLFQNQLAVGTTPTLAWDLPSLGSPTGYVIRILELRNNAGTSQLLTRAVLRTAARSLVVPPGVMTAGSTYVVAISAVRFPGLAFAQYPFQTSFPYATAPMVSAIVAP